MALNQRLKRIGVGLFEPGLAFFPVAYATAIFTSDFPAFAADTSTFSISATALDSFLRSDSGWSVL